MHAHTHKRVHAMHARNACMHTRAHTRMHTHALSDPLATAEEQAVTGLGYDVEHVLRLRVKPACVRACVRAML